MVELSAEEREALEAFCLVNVVPYPYIVALIRRLLDAPVRSCGLCAHRFRGDCEGSVYENACTDYEQKGGE